MYDFLGPDLSIRAPNFVHVHRVSGLIVPNSETEMLTADNQVVEIPPDYFLHPQTGRVLPIQGNVSYDPITAKLIITVDSTTGKLRSVALTWLFLNGWLSDLKSAMLRLNF